jgi:hypothetical protein
VFHVGEVGVDRALPRGLRRCSRLPRRRQGEVRPIPGNRAPGRLRAPYCRVAEACGGLARQQGPAASAIRASRAPGWGNSAHPHARGGRPPRSTAQHRKTASQSHRSVRRGGLSASPPSLSHVRPAAALVGRRRRWPWHAVRTGVSLSRRCHLTGPGPRVAFATSITVMSSRSGWRRSECPRSRRTRGPVSWRVATS